MSLDVNHLTVIGLKLGLAYILALPMAWNREKQAAGAGLRTFPLVALSAAGYAVVAQSVFAGSPDAQSRVLQGLLAGMGFIGGGAILRVRNTVHGTSTAASLWSTAAIGVACAYANYDVAIVLSVLSFGTLRFMTRLKSEPDEGEIARRS
jgi:putative Mg2+ transporter-C (MgtC) family protein